MEQSQVATIQLVQTRLEMAQQALAVGELANAQSLFEKALEVKGDHPEREVKIRDSLKQYSDEVAKQSPPNWNEAHCALNLLGTLKLQDDQTSLWERKLWLQQADYYLKQKNLDESFEIFKNLMAGGERATDQDKLKAEISRIVRDNISYHAAQSEWSLLGRIIQRFQELWPVEDELHGWLQTISEAMVPVDKAALDKAEIETLRHQLEDRIQAQQRSQKIIYALTAISILAVVAAILIALLS